MSVVADCSQRPPSRGLRRSDERARGRLARGLLGWLVAAWAALWVLNRCLRDVAGASMQPTLDPGDRILVLPTWLRRPRRGDVVIADDPRGPHGSPHPTVKRLVGLPGEAVTLTPEAVQADGRRVRSRPRSEPAAPARTWRLEAGEHLLLSDNPSGSTDSRTFGPVPTDHLRAVAVWRIRPWGPLD